LPAPLPDLPRIAVASRAEWRGWLSDHHATSGSIWLVLWKKGRGPWVTYGEVVEEALCFGWVDSRPAKLDEDRSMLLLSPRRAGSRWSALNKARVADLEARGLMAPAGLAAVSRARSDGTWEALDAVEALIEPDDLAAALDAQPAARAKWDGFARSARRGILEWIAGAKTPPTRQRRIADTVAKAAEGRKANFPAGRDR
jgi:uncharacterized protein YdeI (YjbR/CyaY-like superfamily)